MDWAKLVMSLVICQAAGLIGSVFTSRSVNSWYRALIKPSFNPPNWLFAPVWTLLFILMGISLYLVWVSGGSKAAYIAFGVQLALNVTWSALFFGLRSPLFAAVEIVVLIAAIVVNIYYFYQIETAAAYLLLPYLLWVSFATVLNISIAVLNVT